MKNNIVFVAIFLLVASMAISANIGPIQAQTDLEIDPRKTELEQKETQVEKEIKKEETQVEKEIKKEETQVEKQEIKESDEPKTEPKPVPRVSNPNSVLRIATIASDQIGRQLQNMDSVPEKIQDLYDQGLEDVESLKEAISDKDRSAAEKHFLSAMKNFRQITSMLTDRPLADEASVRAVPIPDLQSNYDRMEKYLTSLKAIAEKHNAEIDFTQIDELMILTQNQIDEGNFDEAKKNMNKLQRVILDINKMLREKATQKTAEKAQSFVQKYMKIIEKLISQARELGYPDEIIDKLEEEKDQLATIKDPRQIIKEIRNILSIKEQVDLSKFDRIESRVNQIEERIESVTDDSAKLELKEDLAKLKELIIEKNYDQAQKSLRDLTDKLKEF